MESLSSFFFFLHFTVNLFPLFQSPEARSWVHRGWFLLVGGQRKKKPQKKPDHVKRRARVFGFDFSRMLLLYWIYDGSWQKWQQAPGRCCRDHRFVSALYRLLSGRNLPKCPWARHGPSFSLLFIKDFKSVMSPARLLRSLNITTAFWLCHRFIDFLLRGWWAAPFIRTVFISSPRRLSPLIKVKNQSRSVKLITSLLSARRNHASSDTTVAGSSGGRIIPEMSLFFFLSIRVSAHQAVALFETGLPFLYLFFLPLFNPTKKKRK